MTRFGAWAFTFALVLPSIAAAETLSVGPGKKFALPSKAIAAAQDGDVIEIDAAGTYDVAVAMIRVKNLTLRGVGPGRPGSMRRERAPAARGPGRRNARSTARST